MNSTYFKAHKDKIYTAGPIFLLLLANIYKQGKESVEGITIMGGGIREDFKFLIGYL